MSEKTSHAAAPWAPRACGRVPRFVLLLAGVMLCLSASGGGQSKPGLPTLADARKKYLGAKVTIMGPLEPPPPGLVAQYINWRSAKKGANGRYEPYSTANWARLSFGAERELATIIAIQLTDHQRKGPWVDFLGNRHEANELGPDFDFIVKFDEDGSLAMCTTWLEAAPANFDVVAQKPSTQK